MEKQRITIRSGERVIQKDTREQRLSRSQKATPAIETVRKIVELLKPWELNPNNRYKTYQRMMTDPDIFASVESRQTAIETAQSNSTLEYDENSERSKFLYDYLSYCIANMKTTSREVGRCASEIVFNGVAPFELSTRIEKEGDFAGRFVIDQITYIDPLTIDTTKPLIVENGGRDIKYIRQRADAFRDTSGMLQDTFFSTAGANEIDFRKVGMVAYGASQSRPLGTSSFDAAYVPWKEKNLIQDYLLVGIQKDLAGTPVLRIPSQLFEEAKDTSSTAFQTIEQLKTQMASLHSGDQAFMILPSDTFNENGSGVQLYDIQFQGITGNDKNFDLVQIIEQKKKTIYQVLGASHLITGEDGGGSYNLQEGKANIQANYAERDNILIDEMWNKKFIPLLLRLNGFTNEKLSDIPIYHHGEVQPVSLDEYGKFFQRVQRGLPITPQVVNELLRRMGINYKVDPNMSQEDLKELLLLSGLELKQGNGSSGTGETQAGGAASAINSENSA